MRTLIVEDSRVVQDLLGEIAASLDCEVTACDNAATAWELYQREPYPLVLLDWLQPGADGLQLCRQIRALPQGAGSVVVVIAARGESEDLQAVLDAGADDYMLKPVDRDLLKVRLTIARQCLRNLGRRQRAEVHLQEAMEQLNKNHNDLLSILNRLHVGTALADRDGRITFLSSMTERIFGEAPRSTLIGRHWEDLFPFGQEGKNSIKAMMALDPEQRRRISTRVVSGEGQHYWMNIDVHDDPRDPRKKIFCFYDMSEVYDLRRQLDDRVRFRDMVGKSKAMQVVYRHIRQAAKVDANVLIEGDTGTGKELVARAIHYSSHRRDRPFIAVNCAGLTDSLISSQLFGHRRGAFTGAVEDHQGFLEAADGGTLLLDEVGDIPLNIQASLLRFLQEREITPLGESTPRKVDVRILAATHRDLDEEVEQERFRRDLLYRIRIARIQLPPLCDRREDLPLLVETFLRKPGTASGQSVPTLAQNSMRTLLEYPWPGNVRELENAIEFAIVRCGEGAIQPEDLPPELLHRRRRPREAPVLAEAPMDEREQLVAALQQARGNRTEAARLLGISRATFYRRLSSSGLATET